MQNCSTGAQEATGTPAHTRIVFTTGRIRRSMTFWRVKSIWGIPLQARAIRYLTNRKDEEEPGGKRYFFPNTHEPLIDEETFELAQKRIATKHRPTKVDEIDIFSGLLFCGDCGYKMYLQQGAGTLERKHAYTCGKYRNRIRTGELCTTHYIRKSVLKELVLPIYKGYCPM